MDEHTQKHFEFYHLKANAEMIGEAIMLVSHLIQQGLDLDQIQERNPLKNSAFSKVREN